MGTNNRPSLIRPSTRAFVKEARRTSGYSPFDWLHGYVYARWPYLYIGIATGEHFLARIFGHPVRWVARLLPPKPPGSPRFADTYHGKVVPLAAATQLVTVDQDVSFANLEQTIPYAMARDIVLKNPDHIVVLECPCRTARENPCLPLEVCLIVGEPFASFVMEHHPQRSRWISQSEAVDILRAEQERGHVSHAFFKDAMLGRFYAICNCCSCCCGAMQAHQHGITMIASSSYVARSNMDLCTGCGTRAGRCQFHAISVTNGHSAVDAAACMGCGVCVSSCSQHALSLYHDPSRGEPLELHRLITEAQQASRDRQPAPQGSTRQP